MKSPRCFVIAYAAILFMGFALAAQAPSILEPKVERHEGPPFWVSAESVVDKEKIIDLDLVGSDSLRRRVEKQRRELGVDPQGKKGTQGRNPEIIRIPPSKCKSESYLEDAQAGAPSTSLRDLVAQSNSIIRGTIRTVDLGFSSGVPSSLLGVEVLEVIEGTSPKYPFYVDYPIARFKIGPYFFCNANKGFEPRSGDEVLFFAVGGPIDRTGSLYAPRLDQVFFQRKDDVLFIPSHLKDTPDLRGTQTLDEVIRQLRSGAFLESVEAYDDLR